MRVSSLGNVVPWGRLTQSTVDKVTSLLCCRECMLSHSVVSDCLGVHGLYSLPGSSVHRRSMEKYWSGLPCPSPGDLPDPGLNPHLIKSPALAGRFFITSTIWEALKLGLSIYFLPWNLWYLRITQIHSRVNEYVLEKSKKKERRKAFYFSMLINLKLKWRNHMV